MNMRPDDSYLRELMQSELRSASHAYYGHTVRNLFLVAGVIMLLVLPYINQGFLSPMKAGTIIGIIFVGICAGLTTSSAYWVFILDLIVAGCALLICEGYAMAAGAAAGRVTPSVIITQFLAVLFFCAFYFSIKTIRRWHTHQ